MTWEWVVLILGFVLLIVTLLGFVVWTQMHVRILDSYPKTLPDMMVRTQREEDAGQKE